MGKNTFEPSRGGIGIKLNTASPMLYCIKTTTKIRIYSAKGKVRGKKLKSFKITIPKKAARRFDKGPAKATIAIPFFGFFKLFSDGVISSSHNRFSPAKTKEHHTYCTYKVYVPKWVYADSTHIL